MVWIFWKMVPKAVRKAPEPPNLPSSTPDQLWNCLMNLYFFSVSSYPHPISLFLSLCQLYLSLICFFVPEATLETWPQLLGKYEKQQGFKAHISSAEIALTHTHTLLHTSWNISLESTWRPLGALEFISNTDKYILNHGGERFNLQLECKALDNPLTALYCCYSSHSGPKQSSAEMLCICVSSGWSKPDLNQKSSQVRFHLYSSNSRQKLSYDT